jgi:hypothetical protein
MKTTPSGTLKVVVLAGLGIATAITLRALAETPTPRSEPVDKFLLRIKPKQGESHALANLTTQSEDDFVDLLCGKKGHQYDKAQKLHLKRIDGNKPELDLPDQCPKASSGSQLNIKTDKVTVSNAAKRISDDELGVIGPHVTIQVATSSPAGIKAVLDSLAP